MEINGVDKNINLGKRVLLRSPNWLGDAIMTLPAVHQLRNHLDKDASISILTPQKLLELWNFVPGIEQVIASHKNPFTTATEVKERDFSSSIIFPNSPRTALELFLAKVPRRYAYHGKMRKWMLTESWNKDFSNSSSDQIHHQKYDYLKLIDLVCGIQTEEDHLAEKELIHRPARPQIDYGYIALCPGAEYGPAKRWPEERFAKVAYALAKKYQLRVMLLGAVIDQSSAQKVRQNLGVDVECYDQTGKTSLAEFMKWIAHADFVLCNDSGAMHLAAAFKRPGIAIFGSTEELLTGPIHPSMHVVRERVSCSPCFLRECPVDFRCMQRVTVDMVLESAEKILSNESFSKS